MYNISIRKIKTWKCQMCKDAQATHEVIVEGKLWRYCYPCARKVHYRSVEDEYRKRQGKQPIVEVEPKLTKGQIIKLVKDRLDQKS